ncbi:MAG: protein kinase [Pseudomonadota bacterium]
MQAQATGEIGELALDIPGYSIDRQLGRGGMATVYLALQQSVERRVALKVMSPVLLVDPTFAERFSREARIAANLYHPHIVAVHDVGVHDEQPYIAMEYLSGGDLAGRIAADKVDVPFAIRVVREIAAALDYAHEKGFVHRDVKPENILFRDDLTAVLTDFGIARAVNSSTQMTRTGAVIGTPQYMSPEQARGKDLDGRSDLYGLGIVFYELLTGGTPFRGNDSVAVGIQHVTEPVPPLPRHLDFIQPVLDRFLAKHPDDRFQIGKAAVGELKALEAQVITGQTPRVEVPTPRPQNRARAASPASDPDATTAMPTPEPRKPPASAPGLAVSATPRPDGKLRQEPTLGSLDELSSFDRTVSQPAFTPAEAAARPPPVRKRSRWGLWLSLLLVAATAAGGWWYRDTLLGYLPDPEVRRLLDRARAAYEYQHYYGDSQQYANQLYARVLELDPGNEQARAGLDLVAGELLRRFDAALVAGNLGAATAELERAEAVAPALGAVVAARGRLDALALDDAPAAVSEPTPAAPTDDAAAEAAAAAAARAADVASQLAAAATAVAAGRLVTPEEDNAWQSFGAVLALEADTAAALAGLEKIREGLVGRFEAAVAQGRFLDAEVALGSIAGRVPADESSRLERQLETVRGAAEAAAAQARRDAAFDALLERGGSLAAQDRLTRPADANALAVYREALALRPGDERAEAGVTQVARRLLALAEIDLEEDELDRAAETIATIEAVRPSLPGLERARQRLTLYRGQRGGSALSAADQALLERRLAEAEAALDAGQLMQPPGASAFDALKSALSIDRGDPRVQAGLTRLARRLVDDARDALAAGELPRAGSRLSDAGQTDPRVAGLGELRRDLAAAYRAAARASIDAGRLDEARSELFAAVDLEPGHEDIAVLELALSIALDEAGD